MSFQLPVDKFGFPFNALTISTSQKLATIVTDALATAIGPNTKIVRLHASKACYVNVNAVSTDAGYALADNESAFIKVPGSAVIHAIRAIADGQLNITEMV